MTVPGLYVLTIAVLFGVLPLVFPRTVIAFYTWFHRGKVRMPEPFGMRLAGLIWLAVVAALMVFAAIKRNS